MRQPNMNLSTFNKVIAAVNRIAAKDGYDVMLEIGEEGGHLVLRFKFCESEEGKSDGNDL